MKLRDTFLHLITIGIMLKCYLGFIEPSLIIGKCNREDKALKFTTLYEYTGSISKLTQTSPGPVMKSHTQLGVGGISHLN